MRRIIVANLYKFILNDIITSLVIQLSASYGKLIKRKHYMLG